MENENEYEVVDVKSMCDDNLVSLLSYMSELPKNSKEYSDAVGNLQKLYGIHLDQLKSEDDYERLAEEIAKRQADNQFKEAQLDQAHKEFLMRLAADVVTNGVKIGAYLIVGKWSAILESGGVIVTGTAKNLIRNVQKFVDFNKY